MRKLLSSVAKVLGACVLPIVLLEVGTQYFGEVGPLGPLGTTTLTERHGLNYPSRCTHRPFKGLYVDHDGSARFCTDAYGTVEPTSLGALRDSDGSGPYVLACGGSTTELVSVEPADRWVAVVAERLGVDAVNAGASAKSMATCARTIDFLLRHAPNDRPPLIVIANNVNTLGRFIPVRATPGWDQVTVLEQPHAPQPLHPELRAWIPGLYHVAASIVAWLGTDFTDYGYARALARGCCHAAAAANQSPDLRFDWQAEDNERLYARFVAGNLALLEAVLDRHGVPRERVVFVEEPNAYGFETMPHLVRDYRQLLRGLDGEKLDLATSAALTERFDEIYMQVVAERFEVVRAATFHLPPTAFHDAVHFTQSGSRAFGGRIAEILRRKLSGS